MSDSAAVATTDTGVTDPSGPSPAPTAGRATVSPHGAHDATGTARVRPHFPAFEGLRALAAVMVVVHHAAATAGHRRAGLLDTPAAVMDSGVAVFFVISGFLIYRPFAAAHLAGDPPLRFRSFWWRRMLRIVPAYWLALTFFWALGSFHLGPQWWRYYVFLQIYSKTTVLGGVLQAWSLCTEVTFYLFIPVWAAALGRLGRRGRAPVVDLAGCAVLYAAAFVARQVVSSRYPGQRGLAFDWLPTNLDLFAVGMAVAVLSAWAAHHAGVRAATERVVAWPGLLWAAAAGLFAWYAYRVGPADFARGYQGWFWQQRQLVLGIFTLLLLLPVVFGDQRRGLVRRALTWGPVAWVGSVSYGLYLWHFDWIKRVPTRVDARGAVVWRGWAATPQFDTNVLVLLAAGLGVGLLFAAVSWELVERPLQRLKRLL
ncbi:MAG: acyltransferase [Acidimicrobiales bacterium]|nr:acyltransferase [Acidimicrobiales bacterium]